MKLFIVPALPTRPHMGTKSASVPRKTVWLMAVSVGMIVANIYFIQPLLAMMAQDLQMTPTQAGATTMLTQIGTALGMLFFVPLGDLLERRSLISTLLCCETIALILTATARNFFWLNISSFAVGLLAKPETHPDYSFRRQQFSS